LGGGAAYYAGRAAATNNLFDKGIKVVAWRCGDFVGGWDAVFGVGGGKGGLEFRAEFLLDGLVLSEVFETPG
jgi:hypothetical protein